MIKSYLDPIVGHIQDIFALLQLTPEERAGILDPDPDGEWTPFMAEATRRMAELLRIYAIDSDDIHYIMDQLRRANNELQTNLHP